MDAVKEIVLSLGDSVSFYKVGMELFYAEGAKTIRFLQEQNKQIFLDLKLHDIPNTVAHGVSSLTRLGASLITLHGQGGPVMMKAAVEAARESGETLGVERPKLLAITALTSFDDESWTAIGGQLPISDQVIRLAKLAKDCGMDGVVCSALEAKMIREACGDDFLIVTPGIRPSFATTDDQKRIATPASALQDGASRLVIGRPITQAENPREAVRLIIEEMEKVSKMMTEQEVKQLLIDTQAILEGHFLLTSGLIAQCTLKNSTYCNIQNYDRKHFVKN